MKIIYRIHAVMRMFERNISAEDLRFILENSTTIENYEDSLYPAHLLLGRRHKRPLHVVAADNAADDEAIVVTAYEPDAHYWKPGFRQRR